MPGKTVVGIFVADLHLSHRPPAARAEADWYAAQADVLGRLRDLCEKHAPAPLVYAGDVCHGPEQPPALLCWALRHLPKGYAVAGNHDVKHGSRKSLFRTAYGVLVRAGLLTDLKPGKPVDVGQLRLHGFPHGHPPVPCKYFGGLALDVAVVHRYVWVEGCAYPKAATNREVGAYRAALKGYDVAVFGDNHHGFTAKAGKCLVYNCGLLQQRRRDERDLEPAVGLLREDGTMTREPLGGEPPRWSDRPAKDDKGQGGTTTALLEALLKTAEAGVGFSEAVRRRLDAEPPPKEVAAWVRDVLARAEGEESG